MSSQVLLIGYGENDNLLPPNINSAVIIRKTQDKFQRWDILQSTGPNCPQNYQGHQNQGKPEKISSQGKPKGTWRPDKIWRPG